MIDHHVLRVHHVHPGQGELAWDIGLLLFGAGLVVAGVALIGRGRKDGTLRPAHVGSTT